MSGFEKVERAIAEIRAGRMVILVDDEDRENEGDLCMAAELVTPEAINFMAKEARGLICLTLEEERIRRLNLPMMVSDNQSPFETAFTVSIEAAEGVTTGISAHDRAHTILTAVAKDARPEDLVRPGHVFPLRARRGGVLVRTGQTEGSVDLARLAGLNPSAVICEIMNDDGSMARMPDLERFAEEHGLRILTIADLIQYRLQTETLVRRTEEREIILDQTGTRWRAIAFEVMVENRPAFALVRGDVSVDEPILCRVHSGSTVADLFCSGGAGGGRVLRAAIDRIEEEGRGVLLYLASTRSLAEELGSLPVGPREVKTPGAVPPAAESHGGFSDGRTGGPGARQILRRFGLGAQMLAELGVRKLRLLTNTPLRIAGLTGYGLEVVERVGLDLE